MNLSGASCLPRNPERPAVAGGGMEQRDGAFGTMLVPVVGALELVRRVDCIGHRRDAGHVRALSCMSAPADAVDGPVDCLLAS